MSDRAERTPSKRRSAGYSPVLDIRSESPSSGALPPADESEPVLRSGSPTTPSIGGVEARRDPSEGRLTSVPGRRRIVVRPTILGRPCVGASDSKVSRHCVSTTTCAHFTYAPSGVAAIGLEVRGAARLSMGLGDAIIRRNPSLRSARMSGRWSWRVEHRELRNSNAGLLSSPVGHHEIPANAKGDCIRRADPFILPVAEMPQRGALTSQLHSSSMSRNRSAVHRVIRSRKAIRGGRQ